MLPSPSRARKTQASRRRCAKAGARPLDPLSMQQPPPVPLSWGRGRLSRTLRMQALEKIASEAWTNASIELLALTARTSRRLRPKAKVGFYGLPHKQYWPQPQLNKTQQGWNDLFLPIWKECNALYPSIYEPYESGCHDAGCAPLTQNTAYVDATIREAVRVSKLVGGDGSHDTAGALPVLPYAWCAKLSSVLCVGISQTPTA